MLRGFCERALLCWMEPECLPVLCEFWELFTLQLPAMIPRSRPEGILMQSLRALSLRSSLLVCSVSQTPAASAPLNSSLPPQSSRLLCSAWLFLLGTGRRVVTGLLSLVSLLAGIIVLLCLLFHCLKAVFHILSSLLVTRGRRASPIHLFIYGWQQK